MDLRYDIKLQNAWIEIIRRKASEASRWWRNQRMSTRRATNAKARSSLAIRKAEQNPKYACLVSFFLSNMRRFLRTRAKGETHIRF